MNVQYYIHTYLHSINYLSIYLTHNRTIEERESGRENTRMFQLPPLNRQSLPMLNVDHEEQGYVVTHPHTHTHTHTRTHTCTHSERDTHTHTHIHTHTHTNIHTETQTHAHTVVRYINSSS